MESKLSTAIEMSYRARDQPLKKKNQLLQEVFSRYRKEKQTNLHWKNQLLAGSHMACETLEILASLILSCSASLTRKLFSTTV